MTCSSFAERSMSTMWARQVLLILEIRRLLFDEGLTIAGRLGNGLPRPHCYLPWRGNGAGQRRIVAQDIHHRAGRCGDTRQTAAAGHRHEGLVGIVVGGQHDAHETFHEGG